MARDLRGVSVVSQELLCGKRKGQRLHGKSGWKNQFTLIGRMALR